MQVQVTHWTKGLFPFPLTRVTAEVLSVPFVDGASQFDSPVNYVLF